MADEMNQQLMEHVKELSSHHVQVSYLFVGILVLVLGLAGVGGYLGLRSYEAQVSKAEALEEKYNQDRKEFMSILAEHDAQRAQDAKEQAALLAQIAARARQAPPPVVAEGLKPDADAKAVANALGALVPSEVAPEPIEGPKIALSVPNAQEMAFKLLQGQKDQADLLDTQKLYGLEKDKNLSLTKDLDQCVDTNAQSQKVIEAYKKAAVKSKWRKVLDGVEKVGLVIIGGYIGHRL